jgi:hypothetical protein
MGLLISDDQPTENPINANRARARIALNEYEQRRLRQCYCGTPFGPDQPMHLVAGEKWPICRACFVAWMIDMDQRD